MPTGSSICPGEWRSPSSSPEGFDGPRQLTFPTGRLAFCAGLSTTRRPEGGTLLFWIVLACALWFYVARLAARHPSNPWVAMAAVRRRRVPGELRLRRVGQRSSRGGARRRGRSRIASRRVELVPLVVLLGWMSLIKFTYLIAAVLVLTIVSGTRLLKGDRSFYALPMLYGASVVAWWAIAGQPIADLPVYLRNGIDVAGGYSEGMVVGSSLLQPAWFFLRSCAVVGLFILVGLAGPEQRSAAPVERRSRRISAADLQSRIRTSRYLPCDAGRGVAAGLLVVESACWSLQRARAAIFRGPFSWLSCSETVQIVYQGRATASLLRAGLWSRSRRSGATRLPRQATSEAPRNWPVSVRPDRDTWCFMRPKSAR